MVDHPYKWITRISAVVGQATIASMHVTGVMHPAEIRRVGKARSWDIRCSRVPALGDGITRALPSRIMGHATYAGTGVQSRRS